MKEMDAEEVLAGASEQSMRGEGPQQSKLLGLNDGHVLKKLGQNGFGSSGASEEAFSSMNLYKSGNLDENEIDEGAAEEAQGGSPSGQNGGKRAPRKSFRRRVSELRLALSKELENYEALKMIEASTGVKKLDLVSWFGVLMSISLVLGLGARNWCELAAFVFPAYATVEVLIERDKSQAVRWITYWVIVSFMNLLEIGFGPWLLRICPFYYPFKLGFVFWLQSPQKRGSLYVHSHILAPFLKCHEAKASFHSK